MADFITTEQARIRTRSKRKIEEFDSSTSSKKICLTTEGPEYIVEPFKSSLLRNIVKIPNFDTLKSKDQEWKSHRYRTHMGYPFVLCARPNGLRCTEQHNKCMAIWFKPLPYDLGESLAKAKLSLAISNSRGAEKGLKIEVKEYTWDEADTTSDNPAFSFDLSAFQHSAIEEANCIDSDGSLTLIIDEDISDSTSFITEK